MLLWTETKNVYYTTNLHLYDTFDSLDEIDDTTMSYMLDAKKDY